jgi:hypothetical protein
MFEVNPYHALTYKPVKDLLRIFRDDKEDSYVSVIRQPGAETDVAEKLVGGSRLASF